MITNFKDFLDNLIVESLHPELQSVVTSKTSRKSKQKALSDKIKELSSRGEKTGIEGNMPKGSSRAYLKHEEPHSVIIDGKPAAMRTGIKVAIKSPIEKYHYPHSFDDMSLGQLQNRAENGDHWVNRSYRTLTNEGDHKFSSNHDAGIFPPLLHHDEEHHQWSHIGHADDITPNNFQQLTKTPEFPNGLTHQQFYTTLNRFHDRNHGKYWESTPENERNKDHWEKHPLVQKFMDYHGNTSHPPHDLAQIKNMGVWKHPVDGSEHIVARDSGYSTDVSEAYRRAFKKRAGVY